MSPLRGRVTQHLVKRDSSVPTGTSAASLNPDYVTEIEWWEHPRFGERAVLEAAELVAFDVLDPALRSRGNISAAAKEVYEGEQFREETQELFGGEPAGRLSLPSMELLRERIERLEGMVNELERRVP